MAYDVVWRSQAEKEFDRLPKGIAAKIDQAVLDLRFDPRPPGSIKLHGKLEGQRRIKVGKSYRVLYRVDVANRTVRIISVGSREGFYG